MNSANSKMNPIWLQDQFDPRGVRKYRSIEDANAGRERWGQERVDRLRAARAKKN